MIGNALALLDASANGAGAAHEDPIDRLHILARGATIAHRPEGIDKAGVRHALEQAGAFAIVLELVIAEVSEQISRSVGIPTIGIGSGPKCDGQILVTHDLWGTFPWFTPRFVKPKVNAAEQS